MSCMKTSIGVDVTICEVLFLITVRVPYGFRYIKHSTPDLLSWLLAQHALSYPSSM